MSASHKPWTTIEHASFVSDYPFFSNPYLAQKYGRTLSAIDNRGRKYGLYKHRDFKDEGAQFLPGHSTWNKGKPHNPPGSEKARFKPGHTLTRARPIGAERITQGVLFRKVADNRGSNMTNTNFKPVKNLVWCEKHGPIPAGKMVRVMTGNPEDARRLECLALVTRAENLKLNAVTGEKKRQAGLKGWATRMESRA